MYTYTYTPRMNSRSFSCKSSNQICFSYYYYVRELLVTSQKPATRYTPRDGERPDLDYVPWHCPERVARATCPDGDDGPLLGSFTFVGHVVDRGGLEGLKQIKVQRNNTCPGAPVSNGRLAMLGIELPTLWEQRAGLPESTAVDDRFRYVAPELKFTVPYSSTGYHFETESGCDIRPVVPTPGTPRPLLAAYLGTPLSPLRKKLLHECTAAKDCVVQATRRATRRDGFVGFAHPGQEGLYLKATFALQPWGDTMTRKGYWDALAAGAINVIFAAHNRTVPDEVFADTLIGPHAEYTVTVPQDVWEKKSTLSYLRKISLTRVKDLQDAVMRVRPHGIFTRNYRACRDDAAFAIATGLAQQFRAHQARDGAGGGSRGDGGFSE